MRVNYPFLNTILPGQGKQVDKVPYIISDTDRQKTGTYIKLNRLVIVNNSLCFLNVWFFFKLKNYNTYSQLVTEIRL